MTHGHTRERFYNWLINNLAIISKEHMKWGKQTAEEKVTTNYLSKYYRGSDFTMPTIVLVLPLDVALKWLIFMV